MFCKASDEGAEGYDLLHEEASVAYKNIDPVIQVSLRPAS